MNYKTLFVVKRCMLECLLIQTQPNVRSCFLSVIIVQISEECVDTFPGPLLRVLKLRRIKQNFEM